ncbi:PilZ domain-containing protein [Maridesulfovibrio hydrothermalis]|uniref:Type IV pilus assembly PilZ n=1 Tax=Maridesulfovibrio hydrothermalis AM13 = DSM 14728 TaxID=1121451 RepID=L0R9B1_9BACT|nr:PilZ domain-containing protein [Maridesulfovibrio hydrothermalis]CCO22171.1 Type IV pilus assembly PilZ [Maridesulfovibrio hydrothermalis AM13 = DSM 14728]
MPGTDRIFVIAFVDSHLPYQGMNIHSKLDIKFCTDLDSFFEEMLKTEHAGLILEMHKVMDTPALERNKIFAFAASKPVLRTRAKSKTADLVDDPDQFINNCKTKKKGRIRRFERTEVDLQIQISCDNDHAMASDFSGTIRNISETGCFIETRTDFSENKFIHIKINDISNKLPIYAALCWTKNGPDKLYGYGVKFISIQEDQSAELVKKYSPST